MARIDKYDPTSGGTRGVLDVPLNEADLDKAIGVGLTAAGRVVKGSGTTGIIGVLVNTRKSNQAGSVVDIMQHGDIVGDEFPAGSVHQVTDAGVISAVTTPGVVPSTAAFVGFTVEAGRLVVRFERKDLVV